MVAPEQIIDYLALLGDSSDVIEGVAGIGPKTAASILQQCNSLVEFFANPSLLTNPKVQAKLLAAQAQIERNRQLITLRTQWPEAELGSAAESLQKREPDWAKIADFAREYELKSILKELPEAFQTPATPAAEVKKSPEQPAADDLFAWSSGQKSISRPDKPEESMAKPIQDSLF